MVEIERWEQTKEHKDIIDAIKKIKELKRQQLCPDRNGMISALSEAKQTAPLAITAIELLQGDNRLMPWNSFSDADLYRKLGQYQQGLTNYCIEKVGKRLFDELMK